MKKTYRILKPEAQEQKNLVDWLEWNNYKFTSIPNSTYTTSWNQKTLNRVTGLRPGLPDILLILKCGSLLFIEMKLPGKQLKSGGIGKSKSKISDNQKSWIQTLHEIDNVEAHICFGYEEAKKLIIELENKGLKTTL